MAAVRLYYHPRQILIKHFSDMTDSWLTQDCARYGYPLFFMDNAALPRRSLLILSKGAKQISTLPSLLPEYRLLFGTVRDIAQADDVLAWGRKPSALRVQAVAEEAGLPLLTVEDGFLRSVGLGAEEPPPSLIVDPVGIYYDATAPSRLEQLIPVPQTQAQILRACALQARWCEERVSKYNGARIEACELSQPCVLVADQTCGDASLQGATAVDFERMLEAALTEHPHSTVAVKVHPDVVAGRKQGHFDLAKLRKHPRIQLISDNRHPAERPGCLPDDLTTGLRRTVVGRARAHLWHAVHCRLGVDHRLTARPCAAPTGES